MTRKMTPITSGWRLGCRGMEITDTALRRRLGRYLSIVRYKGYVILVPESEQAYVSANGYNRAHCFWPNLLDGGLRWPSEANDFDYGWPQKN
jgi:hypothetical protein